MCSHNVVYSFMHMKLYRRGMASWTVTQLYNSKYRNKLLITLQTIYFQGIELKSFVQYLVEHMILQLEKKYVKFNTLFISGRYIIC